MRLIGVDFSSTPSRRKPITAAHGELRAGTLHVSRVDRLPDWPAFETLLAAPGPWVGGFDFPFGLPRELVEHLGWPTGWADCIRRYASLTRDEIRRTFAAFCNERPPGGKFAHRACDRPAGSSPSMKWVNPPVAFMLHAGAPRLLAAGCHLPAVHAGDPARVALEAYPGMVARAITRESYKNDARALQTPARREARTRIVAALRAGAHPGGLPFAFAPALEAEMLDDATGDVLDAVLCLVPAAWAWQRREAGWGLPPGTDPLEGWIALAWPEGSTPPAARACA